jgi:hypothetical protein
MTNLVAALLITNSVADVEVSTNLAYWEPLLRIRESNNLPFVVIVPAPRMLFLRAIQPGAPFPQTNTAVQVYPAL